MISNYGTPGKKFLEYLDHVLKTIIQKSWSYIKYSGEFLKKIKNVDKVSNGTSLIKADIVCLYPYIRHKADF